jgi:Domain of unknown function (DUF1707)
MVSDAGMRASDSDREKVVEILGVAYTEGRLTLDEFDDRTTAAYSAKTWGDLRSLTSDLPAGAKLSGPQAAGRSVAPRTEDPLAQDRALAGTPSGGTPSGGTPSTRPPLQPARRPVFIPFLPIAIICLIVATSGHAAVLLVLLLPALIMMLRHRHGPGRHGTGHGPGSS